MSDKYTILVGAGISLDAPANFPIASKIMNAIIDGISPSDDIATLLKKLKVREDGDYAGMDKRYRLTGDFIRFEMLIDVISKFDHDLNVLDAICSYKIPNLNHYNLAKLAILGNYIITPNFDDLIERAIINLGYSPVTICTDEDFGSYVLYSEQNDSNVIPVFKLHGSFYKYTGNKSEKYIVKETLQASLTSILSNNEKLSLSKPKYQLLKDIIKNTKALIVAGYSGSDDFDIVPVLKELVPYNLIWIDHNDNTNTQNVIEHEIELILEGAQNGKGQLISLLYTCDKNVIKLYKTHTGTYLKVLGGITCLPKMDISNEASHVSFEEHIQKWSGSFSDEQKNLLVGNLYFRLSLINESMELYQSISSTSEYYIDAITNICSCLTQLNKFNEALDLANWILSKGPIKEEYRYLKILEKIAYCKSNITHYIQSEQNGIEDLFINIINILVKCGYDDILKDAYNDYALYLRTYRDAMSAMTFYEKGLSLSMKLGDLRHQGFIMNNMATLRYDMGDFEEAEKLALDAYKNGDLYGDFRNHGVLENLLANISFIKGDLNNTIRYCDLSIGRDILLGNETDSNVNFLLKGQALFEQGDFEEAETCFNQADSLFEKASSQDFLYELRLMQLILEICKYHQGESTRSNIHDRQLNIKNICRSPSEIIINKISQNIAQCFIFDNADEISFSELLSELYNLKEIPNYIHIIYYMCLLRISLKTIGKEHIRKAQEYYIQLSNVSRLEILNSYIKSNDIDNV